MLEEEPEVTNPRWYQENQIYPRLEVPKKSTSRRDPYGAGPLEHLNKRRQNARPKKLRFEREWTASVAAARAEGSQTAQRAPE
ncbi:hypothetical protein FRC07_011357 [Ceratobasidium sp. 392]|nr:hypothetical protein FRC07_011357 [Ceratobasidium sp. 392]